MVKNTLKTILVLSDKINVGKFQSKPIKRCYEHLIKKTWCYTPISSLLDCYYYWLLYQDLEDVMAHVEVICPHHTSTQSLRCNLSHCPSHCLPQPPRLHHQIWRLLQQHIKLVYHTCQHLFTTTDYSTFKKRNVRLVFNYIVS